MHCVNKITGYRFNYAVSGQDPVHVPTISAFQDAELADEEKECYEYNLTFNVPPYAGTGPVSISGDRESFETLRDALNELLGGERNANIN